MTNTPADAGREPKTTVTAKCVSCGHRREIGPYEIHPKSVPRCPECGMPMVAVRADTEGEDHD